MGQGHDARLGVAQWDETVQRLNAVLPDAKVLSEVIAFLEQGTEAVPHGERYASEKAIVIEERSVVFPADPDRDVVLYVRFALAPLFADGRYTGVSEGGRLRVMYSADGQWLDEFYTPR
jgi:hypothetical protein